jgi:hypothetical protein
MGVTLRTGSSAHGLGFHPAFVAQRLFIRPNLAAAATGNSRFEGWLTTSSRQTRVWCSAEARRFLTVWHDFVSFAGLREEPIDIRTIMHHYKMTPKQASPQ